MISEFSLVKEHFDVFICVALTINDLVALWFTVEERKLKEICANKRKN